MRSDLDGAVRFDTTHPRRAPQSVSTIASASQFDAWSELVAKSFVPLAIQPGGTGSGFEGSLATTDFGDMHVGRVAATPHTVWRDRRHLDHGGTTDVKLSLVVSGRLCLEQGDTVEAVEAGRAAMYNCGEEYRLSMDEPFSLLVLQMDRVELEQRVAAAVDCAVVFERSNMFARVLWSMASELCPALTTAIDEPTTVARDQAGCSPPASANLLGDKMIDLLALAVAAQTGGRVATSPGRRALHLRAVSHITRHLADDRLSPRSVAAAIGVSQRMLHSLFHDAGDSVMASIIRERLEHAHADLVDLERHGHRTITEIAMSWGFKSSSHFSRRFGERYGTSPSEVRVAARRRARRSSAEQSSR